MPPVTRLRAQKALPVNPSPQLVEPILPFNWIPESMCLIPETASIDPKIMSKLSEIYAPENIYPKPPQLWDCSLRFMPVMLVDSTNRSLAALWTSHESKEEVLTLCILLTNILWTDYCLHGYRLVSLMSWIQPDVKSQRLARLALHRVREIVREMILTLKEVQRGALDWAPKHIAAHTVALWNQGLINLLGLHTTLSVKQPVSQKRLQAAVSRVARRDLTSFIGKDDDDVFSPF